MSKECRPSNQAIHRAHDLVVVALNDAWNGMYNKLNDTLIAGHACDATMQNI